MGKLGIVASFKAKPGMGPQLEELFATRRKEVLAKEPGTLQYDLFLSASEPDTYYVMEQYTDKEALKFHSEAPWFKPASEKMAQFRATEVAVTIMRKKSED